MSNIIDSLKWRYATKMFDRIKKVSKDDLSEVIEAFRLTASSHGLQAWKLLVVVNEEKKNALVEASFGKKQVADCSELLVLCRLENIGDIEIDKHINNVVKTRGVSKPDLVGYENVMKRYIDSLDEEAKGHWMDKQVYIALGNLLTILAIKKIDSCPMEGIMKEKYDEILKLKNMGLKTVVALPIGYRSQDDKYANLKKVRFDREEIVEFI